MSLIETLDWYAKLSDDHIGFHIDRALLGELDM